ncbi:MmcQ/YjbR family DNA-binding protein [Enterococcus sp. UD-01]|jgi:predicted DNA-binding protein (MmcQ/YjbR family)|uniref:MmcQ/YjbR family DNA-binding protein n=1 Tax=Enterococcus sp. UD-01 TaxID=3373911 RepID=UPI0038376086
MSLKKQLIEFVQTLNEIHLDKPFKKFPDYEVFRHKKSGKWFGLVMTVEKNKLGMQAFGTVEMLNVKADPEIISILTKSNGYLPAYHMNKNHWITVLLDGTVKEEQIKKLLQDSYDLTK